MVLSESASIETENTTEEAVSHPEVLIARPVREKSNENHKSRARSDSNSTFRSLGSERYIGTGLSRRTTEKRNENGVEVKEEDLNELLENNFDLEDALRLTETNQDRLKNGDVSNSSVSEEASDNEDERTTIAKVFTNKITNEIELPPDGGYGWVCCACVTLVMFSTWGSNSSFGVYLAYYLNEDIFKGATKYDYALIAGLSVFLGQGLAPIVMVSFRVFGLKIPMYFGCVVMFAGLFLASFATKLWHLFLTQGVLYGISISFIFVPATTVLPGWFLKRRSFAMGLSLFGTGAGGVTYSLAVNKLIQETGNQRWALRIMSITCAITCGVAAFLLRQRNPVKPTGIKNWNATKEHFKEMFSVSVLKRMNVQLITFWFLCAIFGYNLLIFTLSSYAIANGLSSHQGSSLTAIMNGAQSIGRPIIGLSGDKFGRTNLTATLTLFIVIFLFAFWIPATTYLQLIFFSILVGLLIGVGNVMNTVLVADIVGLDDFLSCWGYVNFANAPFLLVVEVIAQALTVPGSSKPYLHTQIFAGCCFTVAFMLIMTLREIRVRTLLEQEDGNTEDILYESKKKDLAHVHEKRLRARERLLGSGVKKYFARMFYPMKV